MSSKPKGPLLALYERLHVVVLVCIAAVASGWVYSARMEPLYRSQVRGFLPTDKDSLSLATEQGNLPSGPRLPVSSTETQDSLLGLLRSHELRTEVATALPDITSDQLQSRVKFAIDRFNLLVISAWHPNSNTAREIAQQYMIQLQQRLRRLNKTEVERKRTVLEGALSETEESLREIEADRLEYLRAEGVIDLDAESAALASRAEVLRGEIAGLDLRSERIDDEIADLEQRQEARPEWTATSLVQEKNPRIEEIEKQIAAENTNLATLRVKYEPEHREVIRSAERLAALRGQLEGEIPIVEKSRTLSADAIRLQFESQISQLEVERAGIGEERGLRQAQLDGILAEWRQLPATRSGLESIDQNLARTRETLDQQRQRIAEFQLYEAREPTFIEITEAAMAAETPDLPNTPLNLSIALILGLVVGLALAALLDRFRAQREVAPW